MSYFWISVADTKYKVRIYGMEVKYSGRGSHFNRRRMQGSLPSILVHLVRFLAKTQAQFVGPAFSDEISEHLVFL
jgi:hypothetical protein